MKGRIEVWFSNGLFRAYPNVVWDTIKDNDKYLEFMFGKSDPKHSIEINKNEMNFVEFMPGDTDV